MSELESIIKYDPESTNLDFKKEQYLKGKYKDLIKDIMAMANAMREGKKYIITGVKDLPNGKKEFFSIPEVEFIDQATYQQILRENVEPSIEFSYYPIEIEGNLIGVFEIDNCNNPPYMMKKDFNGLNKGDCYVRKGSQHERMTRRDLEEMLSFRSKFQFHRKISVGFSKRLDKRLQVKATKSFVLPSEKAKKKIKNILDKRKFNDGLGMNTIGHFSLTNGILGTSSAYEERSTETLRKNLSRIKETYREHDLFHLGETLSEKINLSLRNEGDEYLEDVVIEIKIPSEEIMVMDKIIKEPTFGFETSFANIDFHTHLYYPEVEKEDDFYVIKESIGDLKHHQPESAFKEELRIFFGPESVGKLLLCPYKIYAKNIPKPIVGELEIEVI